MDLTAMTAIDRAPDRIGDAAREAIQAGADPVVLRAALEAALTGQQD